MDNNKTNNTQSKDKENNEVQISEEIKKMSINELNLETGTQNTLKYVKNVGELCKISREELLGFYGINSTRIEEIEGALKKLGLQLGMKIPETEEEKAEKEKHLEEIKKQSIRLIAGSNYFCEIFKKGGIYTIEDLCKLDESQISDIIIREHITTNEIISKVHSLGLKFKFEEKIITDQKMMEDIIAGSKAYSKEDINNMYIRSVFGTRIYVALRHEGIKKMGDLQNLTESDLANIRGLGNKSLEELKTIMGVLGISFKAFARKTKNNLNNQEEPKVEKKTQEETEKAEIPQKKIKSEEEVMPSKEEILNYDINTVIFSKYKQRELYKAGIYSIKGLLNCDECSLHHFMLDGREQLIFRIHKMGFEFKFEEKRRKDAELIERIKKGESYSVEEAKNIYITNIPGLAFKTAYGLAREGIMNTGELCQNSEKTLRNFRNIGDSALNKIKDGVHSLNLKLKGERSDDEILTEKINELKLAYTELQRRKNTYKLKIKKLEQEIKKLQKSSGELNKQLEFLKSIIDQNKKGIEENNLLENFNQMFDEIMHKFEMNSWRLDSKNSAIGKYNEMIARAEEKQRPIKEQLSGHEL